MADTALNNLRDKYKKEMGLDDIGNFSNGRAWVVKEGQMWHIKEDGTDLSSERYDEVYSFFEGRARVIKDGQEWYIDIDGNKIEEQIYNMADKEFVNGIFARLPNEKAPDFVKCNLSIKRAELIEWLSARTDEWINVQVLESKKGGYYCAVDTWKPDSAKQEYEDIDVEVIPF